MKDLCVARNTTTVQIFFLFVGLGLIYFIYCSVFDGEFLNQVYITGGIKIDALDDNNNFVEALDTKTGLVTTVSNQLLPSASGGLNLACLIPLPEDNSFVVTGGEIFSYNGQ